ncbi:unnamed protein product [Colias eurytheme]|nr:unnamed protein product [Colias eurytheme]
MSVLSGICKADIKTASDGLLELAEEKLRSIMRSDPITDTYHVEQTPFASQSRIHTKVHTTFSYSCGTWRTDKPDNFSPRCSLCGYSTQAYINPDNFTFDYNY